MTTFVVPFSIEAERYYRDFIQTLFLAPDNAEFRPLRGVLTNMTIWALSDFIILFENYDRLPDGSKDKVALDSFPPTDFNDLDATCRFIENHIVNFPVMRRSLLGWLHDPDIADRRDEIERREELLTGKISSAFLPGHAPSLRHSSKIHKEHLNPYGELTQEDIFQALDEDIEYFAERQGLDVDEFKQMVGELVVANRRKKTKGFGNKVSNKSRKKRKTKSKI